MKSIYNLLLLSLLLAPCEMVGQVFTITPNMTPQEIAIAVQNESYTTFIIKPGKYRRFSVLPKKDNVQFIGESYTDSNGKLVQPILSGAIVLANWRQEGAVWVHDVPPSAYDVIDHYHCGQCSGGYVNCDDPMDLFMDDATAGSKSLRHQNTAQDVNDVHEWYLDRSSSTLRVIMGANPAGRTVELAVTAVAFDATSGLNADFSCMPFDANGTLTGKPLGVVIKNLTVEKYGSRSQQGVIGGMCGGPNWEVENCEVRFNHGQGIKVAGKGIIRNNYVHHNGQMGVGGRGSNAQQLLLIANNTISYNNYADYFQDFEAGGSKFGGYLRAYNNHVHNNYGHGLWTDIDAYDTQYDNNLVEYNQGAGIIHEISYNANIFCNTARFNAEAHQSGHPWSQIFISNSSSVEVHDNVVEVGSPGTVANPPIANNYSSTTACGVTSNPLIPFASPKQPHGIIVLQDSRADFYPTYNNAIYYNEITYHTAAGVSGYYGSNNKTPGTAISFDYNAYHASSPWDNHWLWYKDWPNDFTNERKNRDINWNDFRVTLNNEPHGFVDNNTSAAPVSLQNVNLTSAYYSSRNTITTGSNVTVSPGGTVLFRAKKTITLSPGFHAVPGSDFTASTCGCETTGIVGSSLVGNPVQRSGRLSYESRSVSGPDAANATNLHDAFPNPTTSTTTIPYSIGSEGKVKVWVTSVIGKTIATLVDSDHHPSGNFKVGLDTSPIPAGIYLYSLQTATGRITKRLVVLKP